jgi:mannose-6-phosphate isomerase
MNDPRALTRLDRVPRERPWGGDGIAAFGLGTKPGERIGEWWVRHPSVPLLVKLLDAREDLSIQLHPDDATARALALGPTGKTEAWYVLDASPGSRILLGLREGVSVDAFIEAAQRGSGVDALLNEITPLRGQLLFIPPGTIHAIGAGCTLLEVQQDSDLTLRVFDWNRQPPRPLHLAEAKTVLQRAAAAPMGVGPCVMLTRSLTCPYFDLEVVHATHRTVFTLSEDEIWFIAHGSAEFVLGDDALVLQAGEFLHAARGALTVRPTGATELIRTRARTQRTD